MTKEQRDSIIDTLLQRWRLERVQSKFNHAPDGKEFLLLYLEKSDGKAVPGELCEHFGLSMPRVTVLLNGLEDKGLIVREKDGSDRRRIQIQLTEAGRDHIRDMRESYDEYLDKIIEMLGEEEVVHLDKILQKLLDASKEEYGLENPSAGSD